MGSAGDFTREALEGCNVANVATHDSLHPILPLHVELAWANSDATAYDSNGGANYHYEFSVVLRGWENFRSVGSSENPHGGVGLLECRNLMSNHGQFQRLHELARVIEPWSFDAFGKKADAERREEFFAANYMDLHIVKPNCGIGLHRRRRIRYDVRNQHDCRQGRVVSKVAEVPASAVGLERDAIGVTLSHPHPLPRLLAVGSRHTR